MERRKTRTPNRNSKNDRKLSVCICSSFLKLVKTVQDVTKKFIYICRVIIFKLLNSSLLFWEKVLLLIKNSPHSMERNII